MNDQMLIYEVEGRVAYLTLNYPEKLNVLSLKLKEELDDAIGKIERNDDIWGVILTGRGRAFCAGTDISEFPETAEETRKVVLWSQRIMNRIEQLDKPVIVAINGMALGGGLEMALACDIRVASENARMGLVEVKVGAMPCYGGTQRLAGLVGSGWAKELIFTGEAISAEWALEMGIVNYVVPDGSEMDKAKEIMGKILKNAPLSVSYSKICLNHSSGSDSDHAQQLEQHLVSMLVTSEDLKEGKQAFLEKRTPAYHKR